MEPGNIVKLKLTGEKAMILPSDSFSYSSGPNKRIRRSNLEILWVYEEELELIDEQNEKTLA